MAKKKPLQHSTRQKDFWHGDADPKMADDAVKRLSSQKLYKKANGKNRSLFGYITAVKRDKQRERPEEMENAENGGTNYWGRGRR